MQTKIMDEMNAFKNDYGINTILYDRLAEYGIVTAGILCDEVTEKGDLKLKFKINNELQCDFLWGLVRKLEDPNDAQLEGV